MRILNAYVARLLVTTVLLAILVLTFVMAAGHIVRVFDWLSRGGSLAVLGRFLLLSVPDMMRFTLPLAMLVATVLVFSHLAADNEITAMKACGVSLWQVIAPGLLLSVGLSALSFWFTTTLAPRCRYAAEQLLWEQAAISPMALLADSENFIELEGLNIRVERREGDTLYGIHILVQDRDRRLQQTITARQGRLQPDPTNRSFDLVLHDFTFGQLEDGTPDKGGPTMPPRSSGRETTLTLSNDEGTGMRRLSRKPRHMDLGMLFARIYLDSQAGATDNVSRLQYELHSRMSMALSPIAFFLIGIPFATRGRRSETSVGLLIALLLALGFYAFMTVSSGLKNSPGAHPEMLVWLPNVIYQVGGLWALAVINRH
jgi:lipopolysaccharide export system permease protein